MEDVLVGVIRTLAYIGSLRSPFGKTFREDYAGELILGIMNVMRTMALLDPKDCILTSTSTMFSHLTPTVTLTLMTALIHTNLDKCRQVCLKIEHTLLGSAQCLIRCPA